MTTLTSSAITSVYGQSVILTASSQGVGGTPTGSIQFQLGGVNYGTPVPLVSGSASITLSSELDVGSYAFTAIYSGDANFNASAASILTQTVSPAPLTVTADNQSMTYSGGVFSRFTTSMSGFVNGQNLATSGVTGAVGFSGSALTAVNAGTYTITPTLNSLAATNYSFTFTSGSLTINPQTLTASIIGTPTKVYNGTTSATLTAANYSLSGLIGSESFTVTKTSGTYNSKNVTNSGVTTVTLAASDFTAGVGTLASNYTLPTTASGTGIISTRALTVTFVGINKVYDGTTTVAPLTLTDNRVTGDVLIASYTTATFSSSAAGYRTINVSGISISGQDAANYTANSTASNPANLIQRALTGTVAVSNKVYDGTTSATITSYNLSSNVIAGDVVSLSGGSASFADKTVANGKSVTVTGLTLTGSSAGNYTVNSTTSTMANITPYALTISATGADKTADGTATATVGLSDNRVDGDVFTSSYNSATFASASVGNNVAISVSGISISGADASNYTYNTTASTTANIFAGVSAPVVVFQPADQNVLPGQIATFTASVSPTSDTTFWQVSSDSGATWTSATGSVVTTTTGTTTTSTLSVTAALANTGQMYKAVFANSGGSVATNTVNLTVTTANISSVEVAWGSRSATLVTAADGLRLLPSDRTNTIPWMNITQITITLDRNVSSLAAGDIILTSKVAGTAYTVSSIARLDTSWTITFMNNLKSASGTGIINAERMTIAIGNSQIPRYIRRLDVLPGDVNDNTSINSLDTNMVKNYYLVGIIPSQNLMFLDTDGNNAINVTDANLITARIGKTLP